MAFCGSEFTRLRAIFVIVQMCWRSTRNVKHVGQVLAYISLAWRLIKLGSAVSLGLGLVGISNILSRLDLTWMHPVASSYGDSTDGARIVGRRI